MERMATRTLRMEASTVDMPEAGSVDIDTDARSSGRKPVQTDKWGESGLGNDIPRA